ncbi:MAG: TonB-dependent receptor [Algibacter sp.]|uniref:SusC/RagA family TonB-linked outer membrane protein n=1 Tax=Algibacter sp. TaxID=1872428 RepID=UPI002614EC44|nr:TonB-dependent receptor [Algibacter sp.]MDG1731238.1 TonB-dependent receptor [Algibacter sp.]MDG2178821.1 TonB-dependent receptor [Algibacter sp.]
MKNSFSEKSKKILMLTVLLAFFGFLELHAQQKSITGTVTGSGMPLPGVSITIKGKQVGAVTDFDGIYKLEVSENDILVFTYLGYKNQEIVVKGKIKINVSMIEDVSKLDEVVVIGYGSVKRKDLTGSVSTIKSEEIDKIKTTSFEGSLASRISGVQVVSSEGGPDAAFKIRVRGGTSINASNDPLYVVDGFPISGGGVSSSTGLGNSSVSPLATLDPSNIESIDILKDASATAIYGSRGANGVVIITTKKGRPGVANLNLETFTGFSTLSSRLDVLTTQEFINFRNDFQPWSPGLTDQKKYLAETFRVDDGTGTYVPITADYPGLIVDDWLENITRTAIEKNYRLSINGGNDKTRYSSSISYLDREGIIKTSGIERYSLNLNISQKVSDRINTGINVNGGYTLRSGVVTAATNNNQGRSGVVTSAALFGPVQPIRHLENADTEAALGIIFDEEGRMIANQNGDIANPVVLLEENKNSAVVFQGGFNTFLEYKIADGLKFKSSIRGYVYESKTKAYFSERVGWTQAVGGRAITSFGNSRSIVTEQNLSFVKKYGNHSINAILVAEKQQNKNEFLQTNSTGFELPGLNLDALQSALNTEPTTSNENTSSIESYLARVQYDAFNKYLITASARYDGSSRFAEGNKWGFFPSIGVAWRISNENFLKGSSFLSDAKIRASYGETGNTEIGSYRSLARAGFSSYIFNGSSLTTGGSIDRLPNPDLTWETTTQSDVGLSLGFFDNRISIEADYYNKETSDLLLEVPLPATSGFTTAFQNLGVVSNEGYELAIDAKIIENKDFKWSANFNISFNENKVLDLGEADEFFVTAIGDNQIQGDYVVRVGESLGSIYGLQDDGVYTFSDFVEFDGLTDAEAAELLYSNVTENENWYSINIYNLKDGVVKNSTVADGAYRPGMTKFKDENNDGVINDLDRKIIGNTQPKHFGGFSSNFRYKAFDLSFQTAWTYGNDIYNKNIKKGSSTAQPWSNKLAIINQRWSPETPNNTLTSFNTGASGNINSAAYSRYIEDGSFFRLANITAGFQLPKKTSQSLGLKSLRFYGSIDNVFVLTSYSGWDPDVSVGNNQLTPGLDVDSYPRSRTFRIGVNANF